MSRMALSCSALSILLLAILSGCSTKVAASPDTEQPRVLEIEREVDSGLLRVVHPERFPLATVTSLAVTPELNVTGVVSADVSRNVPVISMASGRILEIRTRLGDDVTKGQVLMRVQSAELAQAFSDYEQALADEKLAVAQLNRSQILYRKGAIAQRDLEIVQDAEEKADVVVQTTAERLAVLGADKNHPTAVVDVTAPTSGVITDQAVTAASGTQGLASPNAFTISDLSHVWIICDVHENDLHFVRIGEGAEIRLDAYPDIVLRGRIGNIGSVLDPNIRTAKVRIEVKNPGILRLGMFARATFHAQRKDICGVVPASAILHLHDRDWVYVPQLDHAFRRIEVTSGAMLSDGRQEVVSGVPPGTRVAADALLLASTTDQ